jgi:hypothetical protein
MSTIYLGMLLGLPHLEMAGWGCIYSPNTNRAVGEKLLLSAAHRTVRWCTGQRTVACLMRLVVALSEQETVGAAGFPHRTVQSSHRTVWWSSLRVPPGISRWAAVPWCTRQSDMWAPDSPVCHQTVWCSTHRQSAGSTLGLFLDLFNVFFWGVAFVNSLVQVILASCELQTQTLENLLVHGLCWSSNTKTQLVKWPEVHFPYTPQGKPTLVDMDTQIVMASNRLPIPTIISRLVASCGWHENSFTLPAIHNPPLPKSRLWCRWCHLYTKEIDDFFIALCHDDLYSLGCRTTQPISRSIVVHNPHSTPKSPLWCHC